MRPVPVVFLLFAFSDQLSTIHNVRTKFGSYREQRTVGNIHLRTLAAGYPQDEQVLFWMWKERRPQRRQSVCDLFCKAVRM